MNSKNNITKTCSPAADLLGRRGSNSDSRDEAGCSSEAALSSTSDRRLSDGDPIPKFSSSVGAEALLDDQSVDSNVDKISKSVEDLTLAAGIDLPTSANIPYTLPGSEGEKWTAARNRRRGRKHGKYWSNPRSGGRLGRSTPGPGPSREQQSALGGPAFVRSNPPVPGEGGETKGKRQRVPGEGETPETKRAKSYVDSATNALNMAIVIKDDYAHKFDANEQQLITDCIQDKIIDEDNDTPEVSFNRSGLSEGYFRIQCQNQHSVDWLQKNIKIIKPWENAQLELINFSDLDRKKIVVRFSSPNGVLMDPERAKKLLIKQNKHLTTVQEWNCVHSQRVTSEDGSHHQHLVLLVPKKALPEVGLKRLNFSLGHAVWWQGSGNKVDKTDLVLKQQ